MFATFCVKRLVAPSRLRGLVPHTVCTSFVSMQTVVGATQTNQTTLETEALDPHLGKPSRLVIIKLYKESEGNRRYWADMSREFRSYMKIPHTLICTRKRRFFAARGKRYKIKNGRRSYVTRKMIPQGSFNSRGLRGGG